MESKSYTREEIIVRIGEIYEQLSIAPTEELETELRGWQNVMSHFREHGGLPSIVDD